MVRMCRQIYMKPLKNKGFGRVAFYEFMFLLRISVDTIYLGG